MTDDHKVNHLATAAPFLTLYNAESKDLFDRIVTGDEKWVHHFNPPAPNEYEFEAVSQ